MARPAYAAVGTSDGTAPQIQELTTVGGGSTISGQAGFVDGAGLIDLADDDTANHTGIALATVGASAKCLVVMFTPNLIISADVGTGTFAVADIGQEVDYNPLGVDLDGSDDDIFIVIGADPADSTRVLIRPNPTETIGAHGGSTAS